MAAARVATRMSSLDGGNSGVASFTWTAEAGHRRRACLLHRWPTHYLTWLLHGRVRKPSRRSELWAGGDCGRCTQLVHTLMQQPSNMAQQLAVNIVLNERPATGH